MTTGADGKKQLMAAYKEGRIRVAKGSAADELNGQIQTRDIVGLAFLEKEAGPACGSSMSR